MDYIWRYDWENMRIVKLPARLALVDVVDPTEDGPEILIFRRERICVLRDAMETAIAEFRKATL